MLELMAGGRTMPGPEAVEFMERLADMIDEEARTEEFCDEFERALNRFRYEVRKSVPVPVRKFKRRFTEYTCGQCRRGVHPGDSYCSGCGRAIDWNNPIVEGR